MGERLAWLARSQQYLTYFVECFDFPITLINSLVPAQRLGEARRSGNIISPLVLNISKHAIVICFAKALV